MVYIQCMVTSINSQYVYNIQYTTYNVQRTTYNNSLLYHCQEFRTVNVTVHGDEDQVNSLFFSFLHLRNLYVI